MSLELLNTLATFGTFIVIAATAIAAIAQLRHARSSNQIAALNELRETEETQEFQAARDFIFTDLSTRMRDPAFRHQLVEPSVRTDETRPLIARILAIANYYESMGLIMKAGLVDKALALEMWCDVVAPAWEYLAPVVAIYRRKSGIRLWENFEYATVLARDYIAAHPKGSYPAGVRHIDLKDEWLEADQQYAASLAPA